MLDNFDMVFENRKNLMKRMNQTKFTENFDFFTKSYGFLFREMVNYVGSAQDKEQAAREVGEAVVAAAKKTFGRPSDGKLRGSDQTDLNMFMIIYVFPSVEKTGHEDAKITEDGILAVWNENKSSGPDIRYIDYDTVYDGFKRKLFGIALSKN